MSRRQNPNRKRFARPEVPLYYQLRILLREQILSGVYRIGDRLPTEAKVVESYGVSRITVRQAFQSLEKEGLIRREAGRGTFVTGLGLETDTLEMAGSLDDLITIGMDTSVQLLDKREMAATPRDSQIFGCEQGSPIIQCTRLRFYHEKPYSHIVNRLPQSIAERLDEEDFRTGGILAALERQGMVLGDAEQRVRATLADPPLADKLDIDIGAPLLLMDRVVYTADGEPVERVHTHYRSDIYCLDVLLTRDLAGTTPTAEGWTLRGKRAAN